MAGASVDILGYAIFASAMIATPGPANMVLLAAGARYGLAPAAPFVAGIILGKQLVIWPIGFGLMTLAHAAPGAFMALTWMSAAYVAWLAWRIAGTRIDAAASAGDVPGFVAGLVVHPLNPKAWAMVTAGFTTFVAQGTPPLLATFSIAAVLFCVQCLLHPIWCWGGTQIARLVAGRPVEPWVMRGLAVLTLATIAYALFGTVTS